jgi:BioD-like phosphotransacetylase family protein
VDYSFRRFQRSTAAPPVFTAAASGAIISSGIVTRTGGREVVTLLVTSLSSGAGKTAVCTGIARYLAEKGKKVGYLRPSVGAPAAGGDAAFMKEILGLQEPLETISPAFAGEAQFNAGIKNAFEAMAAGKDVMLVEGAVAMAKALNAMVLFVATFNEMANPSLASTCKSLGKQCAGVVINKVPPKALADVKASAENNLSQTGVTVIGILPEDRALMTLSVAELAKAIDGEILNDPENTDALAENFMLGAMTVDSGLTYFGRMANKVAILRSERPDMQQAALETSTRAVVVTGTTKIIPPVQVRADSQKVPFIRTGLDCASVAGKIEETLLKVRFNQKNKAPRVSELMTAGFDFGRLLKVAGI